MQESVTLSISNSKFFYKPPHVPNLHDSSPKKKPTLEYMCAGTSETEKSMLRKHTLACTLAWWHCLILKKSAQYDLKFPFSYTIPKVYDVQPKPCQMIWNGPGGLVQNGLEPYTKH